MAVTAVVLSTLLAALFTAVGGAKVLRVPWAVTNAEHLGFSVPAFQGVGALELAGAAGLIVGLFWPPLGVAAAVGLVALLAGAVVSVRRAGDGIRETVPAVWIGLLSAATAVLTVAS